MTKGCCKKTTVEIEDPPQETEQKVSIKPKFSIRDFDHNKKLMEYQEIIAKDPNNKSLTKKVLTKEMAKEFEYIRGYEKEGLGQCIFPNVYNTKCLIPYTSSPDCYNVFADFFGEIIEKIHGVPERETSLYPYFGKLEEHELIDLNSYTRRRQRVIYSEMITRRNLQDIPFTPYITESERNNVISQIEPKVRNICETLVERPIIPIEWEKKMNQISDELDDCGSMLDYPDERLMLAFKDENHFYQGCILNFDDHIQFIVSANNGKVGEVINRMYRIVCNDILKDVNYSAHSVFGHLTLSPAHVGTGFCVRILAKFPFISRMANSSLIVKPYDCAISNEIENKNNGMIYLYTIKSLNKNENDIFIDFLLAFNKLSLIEDELEICTPMSIQNDVATVEIMETLFKMIQDNDSKSYTKKFLTKDLIKQFDGVRTRFGTIFNSCIRHNAFYPNSLFPRACDSDCYLHFQTFFNPILFQTNNVRMFKHPKATCYGSTEDKLFQLHHSNIYSYRVSFTRNIDAFPFPIMMSTKDRTELEEMIKELIDEFPVEMEGSYVQLKSLKTSVYFEEIIRYKFIPTVNEIDKACGMYNNWPKNRGIYFAKKNANYPSIYLAILVNFVDHIKVISLDPTGEKLNLCYDRAVNAMRFLDLRLQQKYAYRWGYGYLTTVPSSVGCGLRVSAFVKLESLGTHREKLENECKALQFAYRGTFGIGSSAADNVFDLSLKLNLNVTEKWIITMFVQRLKDLIMKERQYNPRLEIPSNEIVNVIESDDDYDIDENFDQEQKAESDAPSSVSSENHPKISITEEKPEEIKIVEPVNES